MNRWNADQFKQSQPDELSLPQSEPMGAMLKHLRDLANQQKSTPILREVPLNNPQTDYQEIIREVDALSRKESAMLHARAQEIKTITLPNYDVGIKIKSLKDEKSPQLNPERPSPAPAPLKLISNNIMPKKASILVRQKDGPEMPSHIILELLR